MSNRLSVFASIFAITILLTGTISPSLLIYEPAEAAKAQGKTSKQFGKKTAGIVCGDRLCSEPATAPVRGFLGIDDLVSSLDDATKAARDKAEKRINEVYSKTQSDLKDAQDMVEKVARDAKAAAEREAQAARDEAE